MFEDRPRNPVADDPPNGAFVLARRLDFRQAECHQVLGDFSVLRPRCWRCSSSTERHEANPPSPPVPQARDSQLVRKVDVVRGFTRTDARLTRRERL
jgi:hypothetical protein